MRFAWKVVTPRITDAVRLYKRERDFYQAVVFIDFSVQALYVSLFV